MQEVLFKFVLCACSERNKSEKTDKWEGEKKSIRGWSTEGEMGRICAKKMKRKWEIKIIIYLEYVSKRKVNKSLKASSSCTINPE